MLCARVLRVLNKNVKEALKTVATSDGTTLGKNASIDPIIAGKDAADRTAVRAIYTCRCTAANTAGSGNASNATFDEVTYPAMKVCVPLEFFFTNGPQSYFPLPAVAASNEIRITIKFRTLQELIQIRPFDYQPVDAQGLQNKRVRIKNTANATPKDFSSITPGVGMANTKCKLRCTYVHVTGPEAQKLMQSEQVRLITEMQTREERKVLSPSPDVKTLFSVELPFLHPIKELIIVIRKVSEMNATFLTAKKGSDPDQGAITKSRFAFHGSGADPNIDSLKNIVLDGHNGHLQVAPVSGTQSTADAAANGPMCNDSTVKVDNFKLTLNGVERHPSLSSSGLSRNYLMERIMTNLHSNTSKTFATLLKGHSELAIDTDGSKTSDMSVMDFRYLQEMMDRKEIYVYPFSIAPEAHNPSGSVNFSKVSHARLEVNGSVFNNTGENVEYELMVLGINYNWLSIKDGRVIKSFA